MITQVCEYDKYLGFMSNQFDHYTDNFQESSNMIKVK